MSHPKESYEMIGHAAQEQHLLESIMQNRLPHTLLFSGVRGIGKASMAYRLARYLLTPEAERGGGMFGPEDLSIPETHPVVARIASGAHSDVMVLEPEIDPKTGESKEVIKVDEARKVSEFLSLTPAESDWRVVIVDSADALNVNAANSLLKVIEEPPKNALMILISHNPGRLLPTIRSRCRVMRFAPMDETEFAKVMAKIEKEEEDAPADAPAEMGFFGEVEEATPHLDRGYYVLSGGSAGFAQLLMKHDALAHYQRLLQVSGASSATERLQFSESAAATKEALPWELWRHLWELLCSRIAKAHYAGGVGHEMFEGEAASLSLLAQRIPAQQLPERAEAILGQLGDTSRLHLDKKQTMLHAMKALVA